MRDYFKILSRKLRLVAIALVAGMSAYSQTIDRAEYFIDTDPGAGNGTSLTFVAGDPVTFTGTVSTTGLDPGHHWLFVRTQSIDGHWSLYETQEFVVDGGILAVEYFFDSDPGVGNGTALSIGANAGSITGTISLTGVPDGEHYLYVRTQHDDDTWSLSDPQVFIINTRIVEAEYFFDTDPGFGNGTPLSITTPSALVTINTSIPVPALANGNHYLFVRTKDIHDKWSHYEPTLFTVDSTLPIELLNFEADLDENHDVILRWSTATESDNDHFTIEHMLPGGNFVELMRKPGAINSTTLQSYHARHNAPPPGTNYYRLKQTDLDGKYTYSDVVSVSVPVRPRTTIYPNPATDRWTIRFAGDSFGTHVEVYDQSGRRVGDAKSNGEAELECSRLGLKAGTYLVKVLSGDRVEVIKLVLK